MGVVALTHFMRLDFPESYTWDEKWYEYSALLYQLMFAVPAFFGLAIDPKKRIPFSMVISFLIYFLLLVVLYFNAWFAEDPIGAGLPFVIVGFPYCILMTFWIFNTWIQQKKDQSPH